MNNYFHQSSKCKVLNKTLIKVLFREVENKTKDNVLLDTINENFIFDMSYLELEEIRFTQAQLRRKSNRYNVVVYSSKQKQKHKKKKKRIKK